MKAAHVPCLFNSRSDIPFGRFSNFELSPIVIAGEKYPSVEHWYQSSKCRHIFDRERIIREEDPHVVKKISREIQIREDWSRFRIPVMYRGLLAKFTQHKDLRELLLSTCDRPIHENADDMYWGWASGKGQDMLGALLAEVRQQLRERKYGYLSDSVLREQLCGTYAAGYQVALGIRESRATQGPWLFHMVRHRRDRDPKTVFFKILEEHLLRPSPQLENSSAISFTDATLPMLINKCLGVERELRIQERISPFSLYGIGIPIAYAREIGMRPVIPIAKSEILLFPSEKRWLFQFYDPKEQIDWSHEYEWRYPCDLPISPDNSILLAPTPERSLIEKLVGTQWPVVHLDE